MTRLDQLHAANEITVLCGIARDFVQSQCQPSDKMTLLCEQLDAVGPQFLELTEELVTDGTPKEEGLCPACGEEIAEPKAE